MSIELITGLPGNAKTLYALDRVIQRAKEENRTVYHAGLKELQADDERLQGTTWVQFDPLTWHETVPSGALIFIDECQKIFRNRSLGSLPGKHVTELEEHRHKGLDFVMITQHPSLIDPAVRKLTQTHLHMVRIWGMEASTVHRWNGVKEQCEKNGSRADSEKQKWGFNKKLYGLYKSADVHTIKRKIPARVWLLLMLPVLLVAAAYVVYSKMSKPAPASPGQTGDVHQVAQLPTGAAGAPTPAEKMQAAIEYAKAATPRVPGLAFTAPKYDEITKPTRAPIPAICMRGKSKCKCYSQQGTALDVPGDLCADIAANGFFQEFDPDGQQDRQDHPEDHDQGKRVRAPGFESGPSVAVIPYEPEKPRLSGARSSKG